MNKGFVRVATAVPDLKVANCTYNVAKISELIIKSNAEKVQVVCFPEMSITGYTCGDLFHQHKLLDEAQKGLNELKNLTQTISLVVIVGMPVRIINQLFNAAVILQKGKILGVVPKINLPNQNEYYEKRWFSSGLATRAKSISLCGDEVAFGYDLLFSDGDFTFGTEICEDLWVPIPPSTQQAIQGAEIIFNLSASNEFIGKHQYRRQLIEQQSARCNAGYVYSSAGSGESSTDLVFAGNAIIAENGKILSASDRFTHETQLVINEIDIERLLADRIRNTNFTQSKSDVDYRIIPFEKSNHTEFELKRTFDKFPFVPSVKFRDDSCNEIFSIQVGGIAKRWQHTNAEKLVLGISGGLDSTLALLVCIKTADKLGFDRKRILGITMPGFGTTDRTYTNAVNLMESLGISTLEISIKDACLQHFKDIVHNPEQHDITYENTQARERTQILMDIANKHNGLVVGTGDLSELALGWATYNGDHMSMYAVNSGIPKTLVRFLVDWAAHQIEEKPQAILRDIIDTPVSPELLPADENGNISQKTEDLVGPYELHDFYLYYFLRFGFSPEKILMIAKIAFKEVYTEEIIKKWLKVFIRRFFAQQFKRSCMPDGPKVGSINLSPRGDWRMPSDAIAFTLED